MLRNFWVRNVFRNLKTTGNRKIGMLFITVLVGLRNLKNMARTVFRVTQNFLQA